MTSSPCDVSGFRMMSCSRGISATLSSESLFLAGALEVGPRSLSSDGEKKFKGDSLKFKNALKSEDNP